MNAEEDFAGRKSQGRRPYQEDTYAFCDLKKRSELLAVVADGMGGHDGGDIASNAAVGRFVRHCMQTPAEVPTDQMLADALAAANRAVARECGNIAGADSVSGCTLTAVVLTRDHGAIWTSVGDSPLMMFHAGRLFRLNKDHSMRALLASRLLRGEISREDYDNFRGKSALLSALTGDELVEVDAPGRPRPLMAGSLLIVATDGILSLELEEIAEICQKTNGMSANHIADSIVAAALAKEIESQDNITVTVIRTP